MSNITKKIVASVVGLAMVVMMAPGLAQGATVEELQVQIDALMAQLATLQSQLAALTGAPAVTGCTITSFDRNLKQGMTGDDVKCLQIILNSDSATQVAATGAGSPGSETTYFGALTYAAVVKFQEKYAAEVLTPLGLTAGTGFVGAKTLAKLNSLLAVAPPVACTTDADCVAGYTCTAGTCVKIPVGAGLTVALAADTPVSGVIVAGSAIAELVKIKFTNGDTTDVKVSTLKLKRMGVSDDSTLPSLYLFDGYTRLGDEGTISSGVVTFNVAGGIFTVPAGGSKTISVRADIVSTAYGQTVGVKLEAATDITSDASSVNGTFPMSGNLMSVTAQPSTAATVSINATTSTPISDASIDATTDFIAWQNVITINNQDVKLEYLRLTQIGSISATDLDNIRLNISGTEVATSKLVVGLVGQDLIFDLSASPVTIAKGQTKTVAVYVDMVGGADKTMRFGLEKKADIFVKDLAYGCYVLFTGTAPNRTGTQTITKGTVTVSKKTDSPSGNVVTSASNVSLAKFNVKANGEEIKINSLRVQVYTNDADTKYLRNGVLLLDGVQVGSTAMINTNNEGTTLYKDFNIYQKIEAGATKVLEVKADIYGCSTTACAVNALGDGETILVKILGSTALDNAQGMKSLAMIDAPESDVSANTLTAGSGALTLVINSAYGNQSVAAGSDTKIGSYVLSAGAFDAVSISGFTVDVATTSPTTTLGDLSNLYVKYDTKTTSVKGTVSATNNFSVSGVSLAAGKTMTIDVWATIKVGTVGGAKTKLTITGTKVTDGSSITAGPTAYAQEITLQTGQLSVAVAADTPDPAIVTGVSTDVLLAKFRYSALYEPFTVDTIQITATSSPSTTTDDYVSIYLKYKDASGAEITSAAIPFSGTNATFTNQTLYAPYGQTAALSVYGNMNAVTPSGYANCGDRPQLGLTYQKASSGSQPTATSSPDKWGYQMLLYKTKPTVGVRAGITSGTLVVGVNDLYAVTIGADAKGDIGIKKLTFYVAGGMGTSTDTMSAFKFYRGSSLDITDKVLFSTTTYATTGVASASFGPLAGNATYTVAVIFNTEEEIAAAAAQTYYLKANVTGVGTIGENIQTYLLGEATTTPNVYTSTTVAMADAYLTWSDKNVPAIYHSEDETYGGAGDWLNGYLVKVLPSEAYTIRY